MTEHERGARKMMRSWIASPDGAQLLHLAYTGVRSRWNDDYLAMIGQHFIYSSSGEWPLEQIASFARVHNRIGGSEVGLIPIRAWGQPGRDSERQHNATLLADLPRPFVAELDMQQNCADADGRFRWTESIQVQVASGELREMPDGAEQPVLADVVIRPGSVPLEVGTTQPSRTMLHLREDRGVARWPYGSDWIWLLVEMEHFEPRAPEERAAFVEAEHGTVAERLATG